MNFRKLAVTVPVVAVLLLTGCTHSKVTFAQAESTPYSIVVTKDEGLKNYRMLEYVDVEGKLQPFENCELHNLYESRVCATEDGLVTFDYNLYKGRLTKGELTVDGVTKELRCVQEDAPGWTTRRICLNS